MKYYKPHLMYVSHVPKEYKESDYYIHFLWNNFIEKDQPYHPAQKSLLMKNIEKKFISTYAFHARYRESYKILNLK